jgi:glycosyltransferase involved in cell wall biosynthesis
MARICFLCPGQLGRNPRLIRNADCLAAAGHDVTVVYPDFQPDFRQYDADIVARARWQAVALDFCTKPAARLRWQCVRLRHRLAEGLVRRSDRLFWLERAYGYFGPELAAAATKTRASLFYAQQQATLAAAARAAQACGGAYAADIEDLLAEYAINPVASIRRVERQFFAPAAFLCTMSDAAADFLCDTHRLARRPLVLHNCPSLAERAALTPPELRPPGGTVSLYWFGQTVGPHSCAESIVRALPLLRRPCRLVLRGIAHRHAYLDRLREIAASLGLGQSLIVQGAAAPAEMVALAGQHSFCLGTQPSRQLFHQMAIGNKVFVGMMSGAVGALTDTIAHRRLLAEHSGWAFLFGENSPERLAAEINRLLDDSRLFAAMRRRAWDLAGTVFNWEHQSIALVEAVDRSLHPPPHP